MEIGILQEFVYKYNCIFVSHHLAEQIEDIEYKTTREVI
jgi:hypothetical protein